MGTRFMSAFLAAVLCFFMYSNVEASVSEKSVIDENSVVIADEQCVEGLQVVEFEKATDVAGFYEELVRLQEEGKYKGMYIVFPEACFSKYFYGELQMFLMNPENWIIDAINPVRKIEMIFEQINGVDYVLFRLL